MLRSRARSRSCVLHGDNGCELQGEAGTRERVQEARAWRIEADAEAQAALFPEPDPHPRSLVPVPAQDATRDIVTRWPAEVFL